MRCPVTCFECDEVVELSDLHFYTTICECSPHDFQTSCVHGVCSECLERLSDDTDPDEDCGYDVSEDGE